MVLINKSSKTHDVPRNDFENRNVHPFNSTRIGVGFSGAAFILFQIAALVQKCHYFIAVTFSNVGKTQYRFIQGYWHW